MSGPALVACAAVALGLGLPVTVAVQHLEAQHRAGAVADAAALAAADAASGWNELSPCAAAEAVAESMAARIVECAVDGPAADARIVASAGVAAFRSQGRGHAAADGVPEPASAVHGPGADGWVWPSDQRHVTQGFHDGLAIDLGVTPGGALLAPFEGVVVAAGPDGGGIPPVCQLQPSWWHGPNRTVVIRHDVGDAVVFSSHNHIDPDSPARLGIAVGSRVAAGQQVAAAGLSGCTSGPHTHFTLSTSPTNTHPDVDPFGFIGAP